MARGSRRKQVQRTASAAAVEMTDEFSGTGAEAAGATDRPDLHLVDGPQADTDGTATSGTATTNTTNTANGTATTGTATNGTGTNGMATNGTATNGAATNGSATNGSATNGTNGSGTNGANGHGHGHSHGTNGNVATRTSLFEPVAGQTESAVDTAAASIDAAEVEELRGAVIELRSLVASLVERSTQPVETPEVDSASRVLVAATEAAETAVAAAEIEANEMLAHARAKSYELIGVARDLAESELAAERTRVNAAATGWVEHRTRVLAALSDLDDAIGIYRQRLATAASALADAMAHLRADEAMSPAPTVPSPSVAPSSAVPGLSPMAPAFAAATPAPAPEPAAAPVAPAAPAVAAEAAETPASGGLFGNRRRPAPPVADAGDGSPMRAGLFGR